MKEFFKDLFEYHRHFNQKMADLFIAESSRISARTIPLFCHSVNAHQIWNTRILKNEQPLGVHQLHSLEFCKDLDLSNYTNTLRILSEVSLSERIRYQTSRGDAFENSVQEILFHVVNHFTHHRGQLVSDLRQSGIEPLVTDYIFYKR